jgi:hypothetical protein
MSRSSFKFPGGALALITAVFWLAPPGVHAQAREEAARSAADERAACLRMEAGEARAQCLREVAAARASRRNPGTRVDQSPEALARNAVQRCQAFTDERRRICERMARGEGEVSGSVDAGGLLRSLETRDPAPDSQVPLMPGVTVPAPAESAPAAAPVR